MPLVFLGFAGVVVEGLRRDRLLCGRLAAEDFPPV
jgi:hypothetical protein